MLLKYMENLQSLIFQINVDKKFKTMLRYGKVLYTEIKSSEILTYDYLKDLQ